MRIKILQIKSMGIKKMKGHIFFKLAQLCKESCTCSKSYSISILNPTFLFSINRIE